MPKPNLLFIYTDEQRYDTFAAAGNARIQMPNLNRLAAESTVFERTYVTQPVCTPSRCSLLTGLTPHTAGMTQNNLIMRESVACLPEMLEDADYFCAHHGKWHLGDEIFAQHGFAEWIATEDTYHAFYRPGRDQAERSAYHHFLIANGVTPAPHPELPPDIASRFFREQIHRLPEPLSRPAFLGDTACRFIREHRSGPWALYVNFLEPHMPFHSCRDKQVDPADVTLPPNFDDRLTGGQSLRYRLSAAQCAAKGFEGGQLADERGWRELIARYWGMCSLVDTHLGRILAALEETGQADNTIVVFTSDHGDMMGSHRMVGKGYLFEESVRVPMLLRLPGQRTQRRVAAPFSQIDVVPTLLDLMGKPVPSHLEGRSRRPVVEGSPAAAEDLFIEWHGDHKAEKNPKPLPDYLQGFCTPQRAEEVKAESIRTVVMPEGFKVNISTAGEHELFDLRHDWQERENLFTQHRGLVNRGLERIRQWQRRTGDELALPEKL